MRLLSIAGDAHVVCPGVIALRPLIKLHTASLFASIAAANGEITELFLTEMVSEQTFHGLTLD